MRLRFFLAPDEFLMDATVGFVVIDAQQAFAVGKRASPAFGGCLQCFCHRYSFRGDSLHTDFGEQGDSETSGPDGMFLLSGYHKSPQTLHPFPRVLDNFSSLEGLRCFAGRGKTRLFTQKIRFTGDTPIVLNGRQSNLFCFRAFDRAFADNSRQLWSLFFHLSEIYFQHDLIERYR